ncbi:MAG: YkvA family protein [Halobacteriaceae archaeon]
MGSYSWWQRLKARAAALERELEAFVAAARDPRTPLSAKLLIWLLVAYAVSPIDPVPDVIPVLGFVDELVVLPVGAIVVHRLVPEQVLAETRADGSPIPSRYRYVGAILVFLVWLGIGIVLVGALT